MSYSCPSCSREVLSRNAKRCSFCGALLPEDLSTDPIDKKRPEPLAHLGNISSLCTGPERLPEIHGKRETPNNVSDIYQEKRPTCVTVIGWAWIIQGALMCLSAVMALFASTMMISQISATSPDANQNMPAFFRFFPLLAIVQIGVAVFGIVSGVNFLKLKPWSRTALEILTWLVLVFVVVFMLFWVGSWLSMTSSHAPIGFSIMGAVMGIVILGVFGVPLGIMLKFLRGDKVKTAMRYVEPPV